MTAATSALVRSAKGRWATQYDQDLALAIVEELAQGRLLRDILRKEGMPHRNTFHRWVIQNPPLAKAYNAALVISAHSLEEDALALAQALQSRKPKDKALIAAWQVAMQQLRWSASRRDPAKYGDKAPVSVQVPIQINTTLDLGAEGAATTPDHPNVYGLKATVEVPGEESEEGLKPRWSHPNRFGRKLKLTPPKPEESNGVPNP